jgi:hypothetical protein
MEVDTTTPVVPQESKDESPSRKRLRDEKVDSILLDSNSNSKKLKQNDSLVSLSTGGMRYFTVTNNRASRDSSLKNKFSPAET